MSFSKEYSGDYKVYENSYPGKHPDITQEQIVLARLSGDEFYIMSTEGDGYLGQDWKHVEEPHISTKLTDATYSEGGCSFSMETVVELPTWPAILLPDADELKGYVLRKVRRRNKPAARLPLRFDPRQYRSFPFRPRLFFKHDYVLALIPWGSDEPICWYNKDENFTPCLETATKLSAEQAVYLMYHGCKGPSTNMTYGMPIAHAEAISQDPPYAFVDVRRLPDSPDRTDWFRPWREMRPITGHFTKLRFPSHTHAYYDIRPHLVRIIDYLLGRKLDYPSDDEGRIT